jgi:hypothetical protein
MAAAGVQEWPKGSKKCEFGKHRPAKQKMKTTPLTDYHLTSPQFGFKKFMEPRMTTVAL